MGTTLVSQLGLQDVPKHMDTEKGNSTLDSPDSRLLPSPSHWSLSGAQGSEELKPAPRALAQCRIPPQP